MFDYRVRFKSGAKGFVVRAKNKTEAGNKAAKRIKADYDKRLGGNKRSGAKPFSYYKSAFYLEPALRAGKHTATYIKKRRKQLGLD